MPGRRSHGPLMAPVRAGVATFSYAILGTTARADGGGDDVVALELFCPRLPGSVNECTGFTLSKHILSTVPAFASDLQAILKK